MLNIIYETIILYIVFLIAIFIYFAIKPEEEEKG